jgi:superfamily II DNA/RNA helicase
MEKQELNNEISVEYNIGLETLGLSDELLTGLRGQDIEGFSQFQADVFKATTKEKSGFIQCEIRADRVLALGLPILAKLSEPTTEPGAPQALLLTPTREMAKKINRSIEHLAECRELNLVSVYGGVSVGRQAAALENPVDVVIGTPGRLLDHHGRENLNFKQVRTVFLDSADEMYGMGFWKTVNELLTLVPEGFELFTFSNGLPNEVAKTHTTYAKDGVNLDFLKREVHLGDATHTGILLDTEKEHKEQLLALLEARASEKTIVYCENRDEVMGVLSYLRGAGLPVHALWGHVRFRERERVKTGIEAGTIKILVVTDISTRDMDLGEFKLLINYMLPNFSSVYAERIGRSAQEHTVDSVLSFVQPEEKKAAGALLKELKLKLGWEELPSEAEVLASRSKRILDELVEKAAETEGEEQVEIAKALIESAEPAKVVSFLLHYYFSQVQKERKRQARPVQQAQPEKEGKVEGDEAQDLDQRRRRKRRKSTKLSEANMTSQSGRERKVEAAPKPEEIKLSAEAVAALKADGLSQITVNIGFEDGFKGRGAVAKKIAALAGLNDGILTELMSKRHHAVLAAKQDIADLIMERVDGAQIGKKVLVVEMEQ